MSVIEFPTKTCCVCGKKATNMLELADLDNPNVFCEPKHFCLDHIPQPLDRDQLALLVDKRDQEIAELKDKIEIIQRTAQEERVQFNEEIKRAVSDPLYHARGAYYFLLDNQKYCVEIEGKHIKLFKKSGYANFLGQQISPDDYVKP